MTDEQAQSNMLLQFFQSWGHKYDKYDKFLILFDRYDIPKSLKSAPRHLRFGDSYPVAYHNTDTTIFQMFY